MYTLITVNRLTGVSDTHFLGSSYRVIPITRDEEKPELDESNFPVVAKIISGTGQQTYLIPEVAATKIMINGSLLEQIYSAPQELLQAYVDRYKEQSIEAQIPTEEIPDTSDESSDNE